jgi:hypothetical protein
MNGSRRALTPGLLAAVLVVASAGGVLGAGLFAEDRFQHAKHAKLFPVCSSCHAGVTDARQPIWPEPAQCVACHDGVVEERIAWQPRTGPRAGSLRFAHDVHARAAASKNPADSALSRECAACHNERGADRMAVRHAVVGQCLDCHGVRVSHFDAPDTACAQCHVRLTDAPGFTTADIARFPKPSSHDGPEFSSGGHGRLARPASAGGGIAASCATCHARNLCVSCHVDAPEVPEIQALAVDARVPEYVATLAAPSSHDSVAFLHTHGRDAQRPNATCATCHARASCTVCHVGSSPNAVAKLATAGAGRAAGVRIVREPPPGHTREFMTDRHGADASNRPAMCETCHARATCLECHRPVGERFPVARQSSTSQAAAARRVDGARRSGFHPAAFLTRHPSSAYSRDADCSDCHNRAQFCQACHQQSGLVANARLGRVGYHDVFRGFSLGHGQAARQNLESCVSCHAERDCTTCHSSVGGGFRFSPHGPGFNPSRMREKNPSLCLACHGRAVPERR